jgi:hypothetical protein
VRLGATPDRALERFRTCTVAYDRTCIYVTWGGAIGGEGVGEIWQTGLKIANTVGTGDLAPPTAAQLQSLWNSHLGGWHEGPESMTSEGATLKWVKAVRLALDGKYATGPVIWENDVTDGKGAAEGALAASPQDAFVISLWSGSKIGRANYGRMYSPWSCLPVDPTTGRILPIAMTAIDTKVKALIIGVNTWAAGIWPSAAPPRVMIMSKVGSGTSKMVTHTRVGDVKDTMRTRRNALREFYRTEEV